MASPYDPYPAQGEYRGCRDGQGQPRLTRISPPRDYQRSPSRQSQVSSPSGPAGRRGGGRRPSRRLPPCGRYRRWSAPRSGRSTASSHARRRRPRPRRWRRGRPGRRRRGSRAPGPPSWPRRAPGGGDPLARRPPRRSRPAGPARRGAGAAGSPTRVRSPGRPHAPARACRRARAPSPGRSCRRRRRTAARGQRSRSRRRGRRCARSATRSRWHRPRRPRVLDAGRAGLFESLDHRRRTRRLGLRRESAHAGTSVGMVQRLGRTLGPPAGLGQGLQALRAPDPEGHPGDAPPPEPLRHRLHRARRRRGPVLAARGRPRGQDEGRDLQRSRRAGDGRASARASGATSPRRTVLRHPRPRC